MIVTGLVMTLLLSSRGGLPDGTPFHQQFGTLFHALSRWNVIPVGLMECRSMCQA
jgi:hypothetical protein